jgi:Holliday junction resolvase RusA-like endonuclease
MQPASAAGVATAEPVVEPVTVIVSGKVVAKARPRATRAGIVYTPAHTRRYESYARLCAQLAMDGRPPITGPVKLTALIELPVPTSWSRKRTSAAIVGDIRPTARPDLDNYIKSGLDAINGIVIADDALVVELEARKRFGVDSKLVLTVTPLAALAANARAAR